MAALQQSKIIFPYWGLAYLCILSLSKIQTANADNIVLDLHSQQTPEWLEVSCAYIDDYNDFWVFGCPASLTGTNDVFPSKKGFWTTCSAQKCEILYYGGPEVSQAKSITLGIYTEGSPQIIVSSKYSPLDETYSNEIGSVSGSNERKGWTDAKIDLTSQTRALVLNFTLISQGDDLLLLDKIILEHPTTSTSGATSFTLTYLSLPILVLTSLAMLLSSFV